MVNPGAFTGSRKEFLSAQKALYAMAVTANHIADTVADIQRRYFKRYPISLPHDEEPSVEWMAQVDNNAPDDNLLPPDKSLLSDAEFDAAQDAYNKNVKLLKFRKDQISRCLTYQHGKDQNPSKCIAVGSEDPMAILMAKLVGIPTKKPRLRTGYNVWAQKNREIVDPIYEGQVKEGNMPASKQAALRMRIYKECYNALEEDTKKDYENQALEEHREAIEKIENGLNALPSESPEDRQNILGGLPGFIQPILDLVTAHTRWKATFIIGGPEPADQGHLNVMSFHSGETTGTVKMNFGQSERLAYKNFVMPIFGNFLKKCYSVEDCHAASLSDPTLASLAKVLSEDGGFNVDSAEGSASYIKVAGTPSSNHGFVPPQTPLSPSIYQIPTKIGPPIHARRQQTPVSPTEPSIHGEKSSSIPQSPVPLPASLPVPSPVPLPVPLPVRLPAPSPAPLPVPSPALSPMPSPAPSPVPLPAPSPRVLPDPLPSPAPLPRPHAALPASTMLALPASGPTILVSSMLPVLSDKPTPQALSTLAPAISTAQKRRQSNCNGHDTQHDAPAGSVGVCEARKRFRSAAHMGQLAEDTGTHTSPSISLTPTQPIVLTTVPAPSMTPKDLADSLGWFLKAYQMLLSEDLGPTWMQLVRSWACFEQAACYEECAKLGTEGRPPCVAAWIACARSMTFRPNLDLPSFEKAFGAWWAGLQPKWHLDGRHGVLQKNGGDSFEELQRPGKNGLLSVLAALFFWHVHAEKVGRAGWKKQWESAVDDVYWIMINLGSK